MKSSSISLLLTSLAALIFAGCDTTTQTTSGADYLSKYPVAKALGTGTHSDVDAEVRDVAAVEPLLRFPARIGLVRVHNGEITNIPGQEGEAWQKTRDTLGDNFGDFVPISPLIADMVAPPTRGYKNSTHSIIRKIRLAAARQHLDAVLIYEVYSNSHSKSIATEVANWTIIGAYVIPSQHTKTVGYANALLLDVRNGYPYGTAAATAEKEHVAALVGSWGKKERLMEKNEIAANLNLIPEVEQMFDTLRKELIN